MSLFLENMTNERSPTQKWIAPLSRRYEKILKKVRNKTIELSKLKPACSNYNFDILVYPDNYWLDSKNKKSG